MISEHSKKVLSEIYASPFGKALEEFLDEQLAELNDIKTIETIEELHGRKFAVEKLDKLFSLILKRTVPSNKNNYI